MLCYGVLCCVMYVYIIIYTGVAKFENPSFAQFTVHRTPLISGNNSWWMINLFFLNLTTLYMLPATLSAIRAWGVSLMDALAPIQGFPLCWFCKMCRNLSSNFLLGKCKKWAELARTFADESEPCTTEPFLHSLSDSWDGFLRIVPVFVHSAASWPRRILVYYNITYVYIDAASLSHAGIDDRLPVNCVKEIV